MKGGDIGVPANKIVVIDVVGTIIVPKFKWGVGRFFARKRDEFSVFCREKPTRKTFEISDNAKMIVDRMDTCWSIGIVPKQFEMQWIREILSDLGLAMSDYIRPDEVEKISNQSACPVLFLTNEPIEFSKRMRRGNERVCRYVTNADFYLQLDAFFRE